jgi:hypothetical protein
MLKRMKRARIAGQVFFQMLHNVENRGNPDYRKAVFSVSEWASRTKTVKGSRLPSDGRELLKDVKKFRSALHLWAAFELIEPVDQLDVFAGSGNMSSFCRFLATANAITKAAQKTKLSQMAEPLHGWEPWLLPQTLGQSLDETLTVVLPPETEEIKKVLARYFNKPFETHAIRS